MPGGEAAAIGLAALLVVLMPFLVPLVGHAAKLIATGPVTAALWVAIARWITGSRLALLGGRKRLVMPS